MASAHNLIFSILLLLSLFSLQIHAREFFSKIPSITNNNIEHEETTKTVTIPATKDPNKFNPEAQKQEQEPSFYAETQNSYGLYGHESGQLPPESTTPTTYEPYVTPIRSQETYSNYPNNYNNRNNYYNNRDTSGYENDQQNFGEKRFAETENVYDNNVGRNDNTERQGMSDTRLMDNGKYHYDAKNEQRNNYESYPNTERQGMSDTRFLENGKYYYDVKNEQRNNYESYPNRFQPNSRGSVSSTSELYNNNGGGYYGNTENSYTARDFQNDMEFDQRHEEQFEP